MADERAQVAKEIADSCLRHERHQKLWSFANFGTTVVVVVFSSVAAVLAQLHDAEAWSHGPRVSTIASVLSLIVTAASAIQSKLGFERKWIANRLTRSALEQLGYDVLNGADTKELVTGIKIIVSAHDKAITGTS